MDAPICKIQRHRQKMGKQIEISIYKGHLKQNCSKLSRDPTQRQKRLYKWRKKIKEERVKIIKKLESFPRLRKADGTYKKI